MVNKIREFFQLLKENRMGGCLLNLSAVVIAMIAILIVMYKVEEEELPKVDDTLVNIETEDEIFKFEYPRPIDMSKGLVYDTNTKIIYIRCLVYGGGVYLPYYSENGKMCRYINGEIVEVEDDE